MAADNHPEYPQESPAIKYIVEQVSKIEDAQACGTGYYKSLSKVLGRLDKIDVAVNQLTKTTTELASVVDSETVAISIGKKYDDIRNELHAGLILINETNHKTVDTNLKSVIDDMRKAVASANGSVSLADRAQRDLYNQMLATIKSLNELIDETKERINPPLWKIYGYSFVALCVGYAIGKWVL